MHIVKNEVKFEFDGLAAAEPEEDFVLNGIYNENASFFNDIRNGRKPSGDIASGLQSIEIANCISQKKAHYIRD